MSLPFFNHYLFVFSMLHTSNDLKSSWILSLSIIFVCLGCSFDFYKSAGLSGLSYYLFKRSLIYPAQSTDLQDPYGLHKPTIVLPNTGILILDLSYYISYSTSLCLFGPWILLKTFCPDIKYQLATFIRLWSLMCHTLTVILVWLILYERLIRLLLFFLTI